MLSQETLSLVRQLIHPQLEERHDTFKLEVHALVSRAASQGWRNSGRFVLGLIRLGVGEVKIRVRLAAVNIFRVVDETQLKPYPQLAHDIIQEIHIHAQEARVSVFSVVEHTLGNCKKEFSERARNALLESETRAKALAQGEVELFAKKYGKAMNEVPQGTVIHVTGQVAAIQTGPGATATINQALSEEDREIVTRALEIVQEYLAEQGAGQDDLTEVLIDAQNEVRKSAPNSIKLKSLLKGIAATIQTTAAAQPAYRAVREVLKMLGIG
jgi:hypothetical protein